MTRAITASFDAVVMIAVAFTVTRGSFDDPVATIVYWGSAAAAAVATLVVLTRGPAALGWVAVGYLLFAAFLVVRRPVPLLALLALAYMPVLERPGRSLGAGLAIAVGSAFLLAIGSRLV